MATTANSLQWQMRPFKKRKLQFGCNSNQILVVKVTLQTSDENIKLSDDFQ